MTSNQVAYWKMKEDQRHNIASEDLARQQNAAAWTRVGTEVFKTLTDAAGSAIKLYLL